jgi:site-specific recombinase XerD
VSILAKSRTNSWRWPVPGTGATLGDAVRSFLARPDLDAGTLRSYRQTLHRLRLSFGDRMRLADLTPEQVVGLFELTWSGAVAATWNRHRSAIRCFAGWAALGPLADGLARRESAPAGPMRVEPDRLQSLWTGQDHGLWERTFWRRLHESGADVATVLGLNVEDLDLDDRRAGTDTGWVTWRPGTARLLPELVAGRPRLRPAPAQGANSSRC